VSGFIQELTITSDIILPCIWYLVYLDNIYLSGTSFLWYYVVMLQRFYP